MVRNFQKTKKNENRFVSIFLEVLSQFFFSIDNFKKCFQEVEGSRNTQGFIMRPNCAIDRHTILCLYVPGFQRELVPKCKWILLTEFQWIPRTNTC